MPNWCYNRVRIDADSDQVEQLKEIHDIFENHSDPFNQILPIPDFKNIPNEKGELPILEQHKGKDGEVMWETYNFPDGKNDDRWYHWCIENWVQSGMFQNSTSNMRMMKYWNSLLVLRGVHPKEWLRN